MVNHSKSFLLSLLIHTALLLSLFSVYEYVYSSGKSTQQEKKICVNLTCIKQKATVVQKDIKHTLQKSKPLPKKTIKKPVVREKVPLKKEMKPKKPKVIEKVIEQVKSLQPQESIKSVASVEKKSEIKQQTAEKNPVKQNTAKDVIQNKVSEQERYLQNNLTVIAQLIKENLYYPRRARKRGIQGSVKVCFLLLKDGTVTQITTISSSSGILTRAAIKTITELSGKFSKPKNDLMLTVPIDYKLY